MKIKITQDCIVKGAVMKKDKVLETPKDLTQADARYLVGIDRAEEVVAPAKTTAKETK